MSFLFFCLSESVTKLEISEGLNHVTWQWNQKETGGVRANDVGWCARALESHVNWELFVAEP